VTTGVHRGEELPEPAQLLLDASGRLAPRWLRRVTLAAAARGGTALDADDPELSRVVDTAVGRLLDDLGALLASDVDEQRTNPLSIFRQAVTGPTELLLRRGVRPPTTDRFAAEHFPGDVFGLGPASWTDVDPELHEPGITWGAWKAMTVLRRRRDEGLR
jgi:hypothetical protein